MRGPIAACTFSCSMLPFIFLAPVRGAHYDSRRLGNVTADSSRLRVRAPASSEADAADRDAVDKIALPVDMNELNQLCHSVGLELACLALADASAISSKVTPKKNAALGVQHGTAQSGSACLPQGQLVFAHVMKTGGLTVDTFLDCQCESSDACTVRHADGALRDVGSPRCTEPTLCTMHRGVAHLDERCGPAFAMGQPRMFTVIRDPIERVWSFFNYLKHWYPPYQRNSLPAIYRQFGADLNAGLPPSSRCSWCNGDLSNGMTLRWFCPNATFCDPLSGSDMPELPLMARALVEAKKVLASMDAIFLTRDLDHFGHMFVRDRRLYAPLADVTKDPSACRVDKRINTNTDEAELSDPVTIDMISEYNRADIILYKYVLDLPNLWVQASPGTPGDGRPWKSKYEKTDTDRRLEAAAASIEDGE